MYKINELSDSKYDGTIFECMFFIGWFDRYPCERLVDTPLFFEDENARKSFVDKIMKRGSYHGESPKKGQWLGVRFGEYPVEGGHINWDLGIRRSSHVLCEGV